ASFIAKGDLAPSEWYEKKWCHVYRYVEVKGLDAISAKNRIFFLVGYLVDQLTNGGTPLFYANPSGQYAPMAAAALDTIGTPQGAQTGREINALFPDGAPSDDCQLRAAQLQGLPRKAKSLEEKLEKLFGTLDARTGESLFVRQLYDFYFS